MKSFTRKAGRTDRGTCRIHLVMIGLSLMVELGMANNSLAAGVLAGWDTHGLSGGANAFGVSPYPASIADANITVSGMIRGFGVGTTGTAAARGWGGNDWTGSSLAAAITANDTVTFTLTPNAGYQLSLSSISRLDYRRSSSGPASGVLQYQVGSGGFTNISTLSFTSISSVGGAIGAIDLSSIAALQNVPAGTTVAFRIVNFGASTAGGSWYIFDNQNSTANDLEISGVVTAYNPLINGACGSADGQVFALAPVDKLCNAGTPSAVTGSGPWNWFCAGANGGSAANCSATSSDAGICP